MTAEVDGLEVALKNAQDAQSVIDTGEAALNEVHTLLLRMRELAVQACTASSLILKRSVCTSFKAASPVSITDWAS